MYSKVQLASHPLHTSDDLGATFRCLRTWANPARLGWHEEEDGASGKRGGAATDEADCVQCNNRRLENMKDKRRLVNLHEENTKIESMGLKDTLHPT